RNPFDPPGLSSEDEQRLDDALGPERDDEPDPEPPGSGSAPEDGPVESSAGDNDGSARASEATAGFGGRESVASIGATFRTGRLEVPGKGSGAPGRRSRAYTDGGRTIGARVPQGPLRDLHLIATLMACAPHQTRRGRLGAGLVLERADLRERRCEGRESNLVLFALDASGSMAARQRMRAVKGAALSLLLDAYQRRDKVGLVTFRGAGAELALPPTSSVEAAARRLASLATGGRTPLAAGLARAARVLAAERLRDPRRRALLVVVTDGRATSGSDADLARAAAMLTGPGLAGTASVVVDCEASVLRLGLAERLAVQLGATLLGMDELEAGVARQLSRGPGQGPGQGKVA